MDTRHLLVYVSWDTIRRWKEQHPSGQIAEEAPYAYGSDQVRLGRLARPGDVVWVMAAPCFARYRLPPSLIARLQVTQVADQRSPGGVKVDIPQPSALWRYVVLADRSGSRYYPLNNAYQTLLSLTFAGRAPSLRDCPHCDQLVAEGKGLYAGLPAHLQTVRQLAPGAETMLETFARAVAGGQVVFLSYRWSEGAPLAMALVERLTAQGIACWWDHWMMPGRVVRGDVHVDEVLLSAALADGLRQSTWVVALVTPTYHSSRWTAQEWQRAGEEVNNPRRARPLRRAEVLLGGQASGQADLILTAADADRLAEQLLAAIREEGIMAESLQIVAFPNGHTARLVRVTEPGRLSAALSTLGLVPPHPVLVLVGGAAGLKIEPGSVRTFESLFRSVAQAVDDVEGVIVDGGTDSGVMRLMGMAHAELRATSPLIGVAAEGTVALPGAAGGVPLEPHHTHFLLVPGDRWGDEVPWIAGVAAVLAEGAPSATVLVSGGEIARQDVAHSLAAGRPVVVIAGTGRLADELAATPERSSLLQAVDLAAEPGVVASRLRALLEAE